MKFHEIKDFKTTGRYKHLRLIHANDDSFKTTTDEQLAIMFLSNCPERYLNYPSDNYFNYTTIRDAYTFKDVVETENETYVIIPHHVSKPGCVLYNGIYDIWLKGCENVTAVSLMFDGYEIRIDKYVYNPNAKTVQIPLAFSGGEPVTHFFFDVQKSKMSFIPTVGMQSLKEIRVKLNAGAKCQECTISTVYLGEGLRFQAVYLKNMFYVDGVKVNMYFNTQNQSRCIMC